MTMQENQQMQQIIGQLQSALKSKQDETQVKADGQVLRTQAEIHKADTELKQTMIQSQVDLHKHAIDSALQKADQEAQYVMDRRSVGSDITQTNKSTTGSQNP